MTNKHVFSAGKYYVGDPCYAVKDENWSVLIDDTGCFGLEELPVGSSWNDGLFKYNGKNCFTDGTKYGDGVFFDNEGHNFGVDAGLIGIMPLEVCDGDFLKGGAVIEFSENFEVWAYDGEFHFGNIVIQTGDDNSEDEEDWDEDLEDEDYESETEEIED